MTSLRGVLLDIDGTLVDSNDAHAMAWVEALEKEGYQAAFEPVRKAIGMGGDKLLPTVVGLDAESEVGKRASHLRGQIFQSKYLPSLRPFARVRELVERIVGAGLRVALATSAQPKEVGALLRIADIDDLVKIAADKSEVDSSKPSPDGRLVT